MKFLRLPLYCVVKDLPALFDLLGDDLAVIEQAGEHRWRASRDRPTAPEFRVALWHVDSGPLSIVSGERTPVHALVDDPWAGWTEETGNG